MPSTPLTVHLFVCSVRPDRQKMIEAGTEVTNRYIQHACWLRRYGQTIDTCCLFLERCTFELENGRRTVDPLDNALIELHKALTAQSTKHEINFLSDLDTHYDSVKVLAAQFKSKMMLEQENKEEKKRGTSSDNSC